MRAADVLTNRADVQLKAGALLLIGGRFDDAKVRAEKALALSAEDVDAHILLGNALAGLNNIDGAIAEVQEAIRLAPTRASFGTRISASSRPVGATPKPRRRR